MANTKIRGITVEIGGDTTGLSKALKDINKDINSTQRQLKDVEKLLKLDPGNTELLAQKQKLLTDRVAETSTKLATLKKAEEELRRTGVDENSEQFMALNREIISTEKYLKDAQKEAKKFNVAFAEAAASADKLAAKAGTVADKTKALSVAAAGVVAGLGGMAAKAMATADDLNTLSAQTGFTTAELQKFEYASDRIDVSTEAITGSIKKLTSGMKGNEDMFNSLGVSVRTATGEMRSSTEVFYDTLNALSKVGNETERDQLAMQIFGRSATELTNIIDDGGKALKDYGEEAERTGKIVSQDTLDAANAVNDLVDGLKADLSQTILITGAKALEAARPVIEKVIDAVGKVLDLIGDLSPEMIGLIGTIALIVAGISPIAGIIAKVSIAVSSLMTVLPALIPVITAVTAVAPWVALAAAVAAAIALIVKNWDKIKEKVTEIWTKIVDTVKEKVNAVVTLVNTAIEKINDLANKINESAIGKAFNINIGTIGTIPAFANGGSISSGSALVGEAGPEILTVSGGIATVTPIGNGSAGVGGDIINYNFNVDNIRTYQQIENKLQNERRTQRMGYVGV